MAAKTTLKKVIVQIPRLSRNIVISSIQQNQQSVDSNSTRTANIPKESSKTADKIEETGDPPDTEVPPIPPVSKPSDHDIQDLIDTLESPHRNPTHKTTKPLVRKIAGKPFAEDAGHEIRESEDDNSVISQTSENDPYESSSGSVDDPNYVPASDSAESETESGSVEYGVESVDGGSVGNDGNGEEENGEEEEAGQSSKGDGSDDDEDERNSRTSSGEEEDTDTEGIAVEDLSSDHPSDEDGSTDSQLSEYSSMGK